jgi:hypothetical protein
METLAIIKHIGTTFAIAGSTFAMIFYYAAMWDGKFTDDEKHFMHIVYFVLRIGMIILIPWEIGMMLWALMGDYSVYYTNVVNWFRVFLLGIILFNAVMMTKHKMPMWIGPALAGGSWYYYYFVSITAKDFSISQLFLYYAIFVTVLALALHILKKKLIDDRLPKPLP